MNVQESATLPERTGESAAQYFRRRLPKLAAALLSALISRAALPGGYFPLGAGFMAAVPQEYAAAAAVGGVLSCLTDGGILRSMESLRHIAALVAVGGIRWALGELPRVNRARFYPFFAALFGVLMTNTVINGTTGSIFSYGTVYFLIEGVMAGLAAMFFAGACRAAGKIGSGEALGRAAAVSVIVTLCAALIPLCRFRIYGLSPGFALVHAAAVLAGLTRRESGGAAAGISGGALALTSGGGTLQGAVIPLAALLTGYASVYGRAFAVSCYIAVCFAGCLTTGSMNYLFIAEAALGGAVSCLVPVGMAEKALDACGFGRCLPHAIGTRGPERERLERASETIGSVSSLLAGVSDGLEKRSMPDDGDVCRRAVREVCSGCEARHFCHGAECTGECHGADKFAGLLRQGRTVSGDDISAAMGRKCLRAEALSGAINREYGYYLASCSAMSRISSIRTAIIGQMEGIGELLSDIGGDMEDDAESASVLAEYLTAQGYDVRECGCGRDGRGRLVATVSVSEAEGGADEEIALLAGECLECGFDVMEKTVSGDIITLRLGQRQSYRLESACSQHCCGGELLCGDSCECFEDGQGTGYMLLSDGMGSGGRAAVEGALTCELFKRLLTGGFGFESAVKVVNSALMIKSEDETLATVDCLGVNLFNGEAVVSKAGAAQSYHVRKGRVTRIDLPSLPLGILCGSDTAQTSFTAQDGDMLVMVSDGVPTDDSGWFERLLEKYDGQQPGEYARMLLHSASAARPRSEDDDITVSVGIIRRVQ